MSVQVMSSRPIGSASGCSPSLTGLGLAARRADQRPGPRRCWKVTTCSSSRWSVGRAASPAGSRRDRASQGQPICQQPCRSQFQYPSCGVLSRVNFEPPRLSHAEPRAFKQGFTYPLWAFSPLARRGSANGLLRGWAEPPAPGRDRGFCGLWGRSGLRPKENGLSAFARSRSIRALTPRSWMAPPSVLSTLRVTRRRPRDRSSAREFQTRWARHRHVAARSGSSVQPTACRSRCSGLPEVQSRGRLRRH